MSTKNQPNPLPREGAQPPAVRLSTDDLHTLWVNVKDRIKEIVYGRQNYDDILRDDQIILAMSDPYGEKLVILLGKLENVMHQTVLTELAELDTEPTPKWVSAVNLVKQERPRLMYHIKKPNWLYQSLEDRGYHWDGKAKAWRKVGAL